MNFCQQCGSRLITIHQSYRQFCRRCGVEVDLATTPVENPMQGLTKQAYENVVVITPDEASLNVLPSTRVDCPKCSHNRAFSQIIEIGEEDGIIDVQLHRCTNCGYSWREKT